MNVLTSIFVLGFLIFFHEAGHFLAAKLQGIKVNGFSIGFGPALIKKKHLGVTYSLRALPLGGFVSFPDDESDISSDDPDLMRNRSIPQRAIVISAGVIANLLLAWLVLIGQATFIGLPSSPNPGVLVVDVKQSEVAELSGIRAGDQIIGINGKTLGSGPEAVKFLVSEIQASPTEKIDFERIKVGSNESQIISLTPENNGGNGRIGAQLQQNISNTIRPASSIGEVLQQSDKQFIDILVKTINGYKGLLTDFNATAEQMSGPVKIIEIGAQLSKQGNTGLFLFAALVSINLAVLNALPLPLLDGGQLSLLILEGLRGKPVPERFQIAFMQSGFFLLIGLSLVLIIRDTSQLAFFQK
ncbi:M50 family metallopeptidase [Prochlorococcus sp. MIT 1223]|uniref:M50 family metallopeptidase n=1 Tax=Prochlorococcus sp. MIT 1223 TaxID=3096217 RepID=UPI002A761A2C|nr:site-2 protease family protein [Prochlorococcus sp. MIT 1223]